MTSLEDIKALRTARTSAAAERFSRLVVSAVNGDMPAEDIERELAALDCDISKFEAACEAFRLREARGKMIEAGQAARARLPEVDQQIAALDDQLADAVSRHRVAVSPLESERHELLRRIHMQGIAEMDLRQSAARLDGYLLGPLCDRAATAKAEFHKLRLSLASEIERLDDFLRRPGLTAEERQPRVDRLERARADYRALVEGDRAKEIGELEKAIQAVKARPETF